MKIEVATTSTEHSPQKRPCSLLGECVIEAGSSDDYKRLSAFHYRDTGYPPAVKQIYRARHVPSGRIVGVIVYASPALNLGIRNKIFGDRYKIGGGTGTNKFRADRLNKELELIIRIVVHPTFRGTGLGRSLIAESIVRRPCKYVEMSAAMGTMNPFAKSAGMVEVPVPHSGITSRVLAALRSVGMADQEMANWKLIVQKLESLSEKRRAWLWSELEEYARRWIKSRTDRQVKITPEIAARRVASNALIQSRYYFAEVEKARHRLSSSRQP